MILLSQWKPRFLQYLLLLLIFILTSAAGCSGLLKGTQIFETGLQSS